LTPETTFRLSDDTYLEPDVVVYSGSLEPKDLKGRNVMLVVEIADSSKRYDMGRKAKLYASFGVRELWVIDAVRLTARVFRGPAADGYRETRDCTALERIVPAFAPDVLALRLADLKRK
jgi:Uma2 family endonuclease